MGFSAARLFGGKSLSSVARAPRYLSLGMVAIVLALLAPTTPASAGSAVAVPRGFQNFCMDNPSECRGGGAKRVAYDDKLAALINRVNRNVNARIKPNPNEIIDVWSINVKRGDCEDYVLAKRRDLINAGVPASALSIVYALRNGGGHAILAVHTDQGSFALDNMTGKIKPLFNTGYKLVSMSGPNPRVWQKVSRTLLANAR